LRQEDKLLRRQPLHAGVATRFGDSGFYFPKSVFAARFRDFGVDVAGCSGPRFFLCFLLFFESRRRFALRAELRSIDLSFLS
jgi:hypothetical protein